MIRPVPKPKKYCKCGCGTEISFAKTWVSGHNLKRRSKDAIVINGRSYRYVTCFRCNKTMKRRTDQIKDKNYCKPCSHKLRGEKSRGKPLYNARTGVYKKCIMCEKEFYIPLSRAKKNARCCSIKCETVRRIELGIYPKNFISSVDNKGKKNGMYKHGKRTGTHVNKRKLREKVIERDGGNWCLFCGKPGPGLHLHRVVYGSHGGKYELDNCVQLCAMDHEKVHSNQNKWQPILKDHLDNGTLRNTGKDSWD